MDSPNSSSLLGVGEAARELGRSTEQVRRYLREGRLTGRRMGGQWFIDRAALTAFQELLREAPTFLDRVRPADKLLPLDGVVALGRGGGSNIAQGKDAYRRAFWWRR